MHERPTIPAPQPGSRGVSSPPVRTTRIDRRRVQELVRAGAQLVEVLPAEDYEDEHLPGAVSLPLKELDETSAARLSRDRPVIVYCYDTQ